MSDGPDGGAQPPGGAVQIDPSNFKMPDFKKIDEEVLKPLEEHQVNRLKQLHLQQQGLRALAQEKVANEVGLHQEQRELIKHIMEDQRKKTMDLVMQMRGEGGLSPQALGEEMKKQREAAEKDIALLLSDEQKEKWEKLTGPKFDFKGK